MADVRGCWRRSLILILLAASFGASAQSNDAIRTLAQREKQPLLDTLEALVEIESGTGDVEGVTRIGTLIAERLRRLGGSVDLVQLRGPALVSALACRWRLGGHPASTSSAWMMNEKSWSIGT